jgi:tetratricopeptide (TPR) repeat protein
MFDRIDEIRGRRPPSVYPPMPAVAKPPESRQFTFALPVMSRTRWAGAVAAILVVAVAIGALVYRGRFKSAGAASGRPVTVLVADFTNHTGDPVFDGTLEPMFNVALEGASFINSYSRGTARKLAQKLPNPTDKLDEQPARLVALSQGISAVVTGEISRRGDNYSVSAMALDAATGNVLAKAEATAGNKDEVLGTVPKLAAPIRQALGDTTPESVQFQTAAGAFTATSLEAVHYDSVGLEQQFAGKSEEALRLFAKATELDPNFARAYAGMSAVSRNLGRPQDAEKYIKLAMEHIDRLTERERYRVRGGYYIATSNWQKCVEEYSELVKQYPADNTGNINLAACYQQLRNLPKAVEAGRRAVEIAPKGAFQRLNLSFYLSYGGDFQSGEQEARAALELNPLSEPGVLALAESQLAQGQLSQAAESYHKLEKVSALGASMANISLADLDLFQGRFGEAVRLLEQGAAADLASKSPENAADEFAALAHAQLLRGQKAAALAAADKALANSKSIKIRFLAAQIFAEEGQAPKAQKLATSLGSELAAEPQAYAKIIEGELSLKRGDARQAIKEFTDANQLLDTWIGRLELGRAYLEAGAFVEADAEFERCIKRCGEALELFMDNVPTYNYLPAVYYHQGRAREGLKSPGFADSYRTYLSIRGPSGEDPLLPEIRRRLGQ